MLRPAVLSLKDSLGFNMSAMKLLTRAAKVEAGEDGDTLEQVAKLRKLRAGEESEF